MWAASGVLCLGLILAACSDAAPNRASVWSENERPIEHFVPRTINLHDIDPGERGNRHHELNLTGTDSSCSTPTSSAIGPLHVVHRTSG